jgi:hypothetical protein
MHPFRFAPLLFALLWLPAAGADESAAVKDVLDRAFKAVGGRGRLTGYRAATWRGKGKFFGPSSPVAYEGEWTVQPPEQARIVSRGRLDGKPFEHILVVNGDRGWTRTAGLTQAMDPARLVEEKERLHAAWVATLAPLAGGGFQVTSLNRVQVNGRQAVGVKVAQEGHRDVELYFDAGTGRLVKSVTRVKNPKTGVGATEEVFYARYRDFAGLQRATRVTVKVDGKRFAEGEVTDFKAVREAPRHTFDAP